jgi:ribosomal protein S18 acetylase RimI-like enzyme
MDHLLDNPVWNALISGNKSFSNDNDRAKFFPKSVSPFVALRENTAENLMILHDLVPAGSTSLLITHDEMEIPAPWKLLQRIKGLQMIFNGDADPSETGEGMSALTDEHIPQMLALTKLTNPGPFAERTIDFGHYCGVFDGDKLVAMAGQRMYPTPYSEISAVCTHPDYTGKGYARRLLMYQVNRMQTSGIIPYLQVRFDNYRAIKVYESIGFETRAEIYFSAMLSSN